MQLFLSKDYSKVNLLNLLFSLIPVSFIAGNLVLNLNILLFILFGFIFYGKDILRSNFDFLDKLIFFYFAYLLFTGFYNNINNYFFSDFPFEDPSVMIKSVLYQRYLLLYLVIKFMIEKNILKFKPFFISSAFFSIFVCFDLFYQFNFGQDIFGYEIKHRKLSGPFGDELIAGSYLQRFALFFLFIPIFFETNRKLILKIGISLLFLIYFAAMVISGNRMPLVLFLLISLLIIIFEKKTRKYFIIFTLITPIIFGFLYSYNQSIKTNFNLFFTQVSKLPVAILNSEKLTNKEIDINRSIPGHLKEFKTFYHTWLMNKYIGGGIKSFRRNCHHRDNIDKSTNFICNTHPHNYYLEILTDLGLLGFFLLVAIFSITLYRSLIKKYFLSSTLKNNYIITPFIFLFFAEIFPIKTSGSFFTTGNATFFFIVFAITIALSRERN